MNKLKKIVYFLFISFSLESFFNVTFAYDSLLTDAFNRIGWSFESIFRSKYAIITIFFFIYLLILYVIFKEVLLKISIFKGKNETAKKLGILLSLISTLGLFYYGYNSSSLNEFLVTYLGLPGLLGIIVFDILMYKIVANFFDDFISTSPDEIKDTLKLGLYGVVIGISSLVTLIYIQFLITNVQL